MILCIQFRIEKIALLWIFNKFLFNYVNKLIILFKFLNNFSKIIKIYKINFNDKIHFTHDQHSTVLLFLNLKLYYCICYNY